MIRKEFILSELNYRYPLVIQTIQKPEQTVGRPLLLERDGKVASARIIICRAEELTIPAEQDLRQSLYLCIGIPSKEAMEQLDLCILPETEHRANVLNFVQRLFDRLDDWTQQLKQIAMTETDIEALLQRAASMLQNPIVLLDEHNHIIAHTDQLQHDRLETLLEQNSFNSFKSGLDNALYHIKDHEGQNALAAQIPSGEGHFLLLCTASERALYGSDEYVFEALAGYVRQMLSEQKFYTQKRPRKQETAAAERVFRALLDGSMSLTESNLALLEENGWSANAAYALITTEPEGGDLRAQRVASICDRLEKSFQLCCAFALPPVIVAIVRIDTEECATLRKTLEKLAEENQLRFGVCEEIEGFADITQRLMLSKRALSRAMEKRRVAYFSDGDVANEYLVSCATAEVRPELVCMCSVLAMAAYDREHDTRYVETAEQYIKNRFNAVKTANALFIHRSTFLYRLERMKEQFGLDLEDENLSIMHLILSIQLVRS